MLNLGQIIFAIVFSLSVFQSFYGRKNLEAKGIFGQEGLTRAVFFCMATSFVFLVYKYITSDFSYLNVYSNSNTVKPLLYKITGSWGNHEGSMLLFAFVLSLYSFLYSVISKYKLKKEVLYFQSIIQSLISSYIYFASNPFDGNPLSMQGLKVTEGIGLNPLLQDIGLAAHPPLLYLGYAGFSIVFSIALAATNHQQSGKIWGWAMSPWALTSWCFLSIGVSLGSWWAYRELGWGGFWFWDPVENSSLIPWLLGTALIHSLLYTRKFDGYYMTSIFLALASFLSALIGFFLVRSGVLSSVHSFAVDPTRGVYLLIIISSLMLFSIAKFTKAARENKHSSPYKYSLFSRQIMVSFNVIFYLTLSATIFIAIIYPIVLEVAFKEAITVGAPYFDRTFIPIALFSAFIMVFAPYLKWHDNKRFKSISRSFFSLIISLALALYLYFAHPNKINFASFCGIMLGAWLMLSLAEILLMKSIKKEKLGRGYVAMCVSHIGFGLLVLSISVLTSFELEDEKVIKQNSSAEFFGYNLNLKSSKIQQKENYLAQSAVINVSDADENEIGDFHPENRIYFPSAKRTTEAAVKYSMSADYYIVASEANTSDLAEQLANNKEKSFTVRFYYKPFMNFIWLSVVIFVIGAVISIKPKKL